MLLKQLPTTPPQLLMRATLLMLLVRLMLQMERRARKQQRMLLSKPTMPPRTPVPRQLAVTNSPSSLKGMS